VCDSNFELASYVIFTSSVFTRDTLRHAVTLTSWPWTFVVVVWLISVNGSALVSINEVNLHRARLVLGWVTVSRFNSQCRIFISVCNQPPRSTQPGHLLVGMCNEYQPKGGDALRLGSKGRYCRVWVAGITVWSPFTRATSERFTDRHYKALFTFFTY